MRPFPSSRIQCLVWTATHFPGGENVLCDQTNIRWQRRTRLGLGWGCNLKFPMLTSPYTLWDSQSRCICKWSLYLNIEKNQIHPVRTYRTVGEKKEKNIWRSLRKQLPLTVCWCHVFWVNRGIKYTRDLFIAVPDVIKQSIGKAVVEKASMWWAILNTFMESLMEGTRTARLSLNRKQQGLPQGNLKLGLLHRKTEI